jgi:filamentous hemagglutinin
VIYQPSTDSFAVATSAGEPKTLFVPDPAQHGHASNLDYFNAQ